MQRGKISHEEFLKELESSMPKSDFEKLRAVLDMTGEQRRVYKAGELVEANGVTIKGATP